MKTRDDQTEARELVRVLTQYGALQFQQVLALFPGRAESIRNLASRLIKQKRLYFLPESNVISTLPDKEPDSGMIAAFWVLLDLMDRVTYHTSSDFPVSISFFTEDDAYDIVVVPTGQENLINHALWYIRGEELPRRIVVLDDAEQIPNLHINHTAGFCTVSPGGVVSYFHIDEVPDGQTGSQQQNWPDSRGTDSAAK